MSDTAGMIKPDIQELPQISDRMTFLYLERCKINRQDSAVTVLDEKGVRYYAGGRPLTHSSRRILRQAELLFPALAGVLLIRRYY